MSNWSYHRAKRNSRSEFLIEYAIMRFRSWSSVPSPPGMNKDVISVTLQDIQAEGEHLFSAMCGLIVAALARPDLTHHGIVTSPLAPATTTAGRRERSTLK